MITGDIPLLEGGAVDLGRGRALEVPPSRDRLVLRTLAGGERVFELCEPFGASFDASYYVGEGGRHVLVVGSSGRAVYHVDAEAGELFVAASLYRRTDDDTGLLRLGFVEADGRLLVAYERGIFCLDPAFRCRWKVDHDYMDRFFEGVRGGVAWYESEHEGAWGYRLADGVRVEAGPGAPSAGAAPG